MKSFVLAASKDWVDKILKFLTPAEFSESRYHVLQVTGKSPDVTFGSFSSEFEERTIGNLTKTVVYFDARFEFDGYEYFRLCEKPKQTSGLLYAQN